MPSAVRGGVRARHQRRPGDDQAGRGRDHRPRLGRGLGHSAVPVDPHRQAGDGDRQRTGRAGRRPAAHPRRPRRRRPRARRSHRRAAALRDPRVQDGEAPSRPATRPDGGRGHRVPHRRRRRREHRRRCAAGDERRRRARLRGDGVARPAGARARARRHPPSDGVPAARRTGCSRATSTSRRSRRRASTS